MDSNLNFSFLENGVATIDKCVPTLRNIYRAEEKKFVFSIIYDSEN